MSVPPAVAVVQATCHVTALTTWPHTEAEAMETGEKVCFILQIYVIEADSALGHSTVCLQQYA